MLDERANLSGMRILLVEDNAINQDLASDILGSAGIVVRVACNGQEALDMRKRSMNRVLVRTANA